MTSLRVALIAFATDVNHSHPRVATKECFKLVATRFYRPRPFCSHYHMLLKSRKSWEAPEARGLLVCCGNRVQSP
jgi:hypothetical protein